MNKIDYTLNVFFLPILSLTTPQKSLPPKLPKDSNRMKLVVNWGVTKSGMDLEN
jgi:hypothetical protein